MADLNKVMLIGHLGADPDSKPLPSGEVVTNMSLATTEKWTDKRSGDKKENTEWHRLTCFGNLAKTCAQWLKKGSHIYVEGQLRTEKWKDKQGNDRWTTKIIIFEMKMLGGTKTREETGAPAGASQGSAKPANPNAGSDPYANYSGPQHGGSGSKEDFDDDIPF